MISISRYIGKRAKSCNRCSGDLHFVNKLGGIQCERCSPPKNSSDVIARLRIDGGFWQDQSAERFDLIDVPPLSAMEPVHPASSAATKVSGPNESQRQVRWVGELSDRDIDLFMSGEIWNQPDPWIIRKPRPRNPSADAQQRQHEATDPRRRRPKQVLPLPEIGEEVLLVKKIETFGGFLQPGNYVITAAYHDGFGDAFVSLSRDGRVRVNGLAWPIED